MKRSEFWDDLAADLEDPEFLREYVVESVRVATIDKIMNTLIDALDAAGMSKAALARAIHQQPAAIRRLFSSSRANPTIGTLAEVAAALGLRITLEPIPAAERAKITDPLLKGRTDAKALAAHLSGLSASDDVKRTAQRIRESKPTDRERMTV